MIELLITGFIWIAAGIIFFWVGALIFYPSMGLYRIIEAVTYRFNNSASLAERKAQQHTQKLHDTASQDTRPVISKNEFAYKIAKRLVTDPTDDTFDGMIAVAIALYEWERLDDPLPTPPAIANSIDGARYRDWLSQHSAKRNPRAIAFVEKTIINSFLDLVTFMPRSNGNDLTVRLTDILPDLNERVEAIALPYFDPEAVELGVFSELRTQLNRNLHEASGIPYQPTYYESPKLIMPSQYKGENVVHTYLKHTPLTELFDVEVGYSVPNEARFEGQWICAPQGTGKTQFIQYQISKLLDEHVSIIVIDSQEEMIRNISHIKAIKDRLILIDANDVEYLLALNIFDLGQAADLSPLEQERRLNTALEVVGFLLDSLLGSDLTSKQQVVFRFITQALLAIPNATILTFQELLQPGGVHKYQEYIDTLEGAAQSFFETQFDSKQFIPTKDEINRRLYGILGIRAWERMFTQPKTKLDLFAEMNEGKVICINTARSLLQSKGCEAFGRFFLALITMAAQRRATVAHKVPVHVFIDEVYDYLPNTSDSNVLTIIEQCRKQKIALTVAH